MSTPSIDPQGRPKLTIKLAKHKRADKTNKSTSSGSQSVGPVDAQGRPKPTIKLTKRKQAVESTKNTSSGSEGDAAVNAQDRPKLTIKLTKRKRADESTDGASSGSEGAAAVESAAPKRVKITAAAATTATNDYGPRLATAWRCADRGCNTGQTYFDRKTVGRKVVSNFFGRNQKATALIHDEVWHWFCRMGYQRKKYRAQQKGTMAFAKFQLDLVRQQVLRIRLWRPEAAFTIQLEAPAHRRLMEYYKQLANGADDEAAEAALVIQPTVNKNGKAVTLPLKAAVPMKHARTIQEDFAGSPRTFAELDTFLDWVEERLDNGDLQQMPPFQFLLHDEVEGEAVDDPTTNYDRWCAHVDGTKYTSSSAPAAAPAKVSFSSRKLTLDTTVGGGTPVGPPVDASSRADGPVLIITAGKAKASSSKIEQPVAAATVARKSGKKAGKVIYASSRPGTIFAVKKPLTPTSADEETESEDEGDDDAE